MSALLTSTRSWLSPAFLACFLVYLAGCSPQPDSPEEKSATPKLVDITLRVAIEDDPELERAILRLRGEWQEYSGGKVETSLFEVGANPESLIEATKGADLVVFASRRLGELCESNAIRPLRPSVLKNETLRFEDFLPLLRNQEIVYGKQIMALPIGCPTLLLASQSEEVQSDEVQSDEVQSDEDRLKISLPINTLAYAERADAVEANAVKDGAAKADAVELAITYLAWAAPHVVHRGREASLFDPGLGEGGLAARLNEPPFIRALELLKLATNFEGVPNAKVVWPRRNDKTIVANNGSNAESAEENNDVAYDKASPLGTADENYNRMAAAWEPLAERDRHATLLASSGRLIGVTSSSRNAATAFRYAAWLVSPSNSRLLSTASDNVANPRGSFARAADNWILGEDPSLGRSLAEALAKSLREKRSMLVPRLPGGDRYLESLGAAVQRTLNDEMPATESLTQCSAEWDAISVELGLAEQRAAYLRSIGSADYKP